MPGSGKRNKPYITRGLIQCYEAARLPVPKHLIEERDTLEARARLAWGRYESKTNDRGDDDE